MAGFGLEAQPGLISPVRGRVIYRIGLYAAKRWRSALPCYPVSCKAHERQQTMSNGKTYLSDNRPAPESQIGASLESLAHTIHQRRNAGDESYTHRLLTGDIDTLLKKVAEEAHEATLAAKDVVYNEGDDAQVNHLRYEAADVVYHLMVLLERCGIGLDEFAAELNTRMTDQEIAERGGVVLLKPEYVNRGNHVEK